MRETRSTDKANQIGDIGPDGSTDSLPILPPRRNASPPITTWSTDKSTSSGYRPPRHVPGPPSAGLSPNLITLKSPQEHGPKQSSSGISPGTPRNHGMNLETPDTSKWGVNYNHAHLGLQDDRDKPSLPVSVAFKRFVHCWTHS